MRKCRLAIFYNAGYSSDLFDETTNVKSFGAANLWGSIGGYVGMILGLSFLQIPGIVSCIFNYMQNKTLHQKCPCNSARSTVGAGMEEGDQA